MKSATQHGTVDSDHGSGATARPRAEAPRLAAAEGEKKAVALWRAAEAQRAAGRYHDSLSLYEEAVPLLSAGGEHTLRGDFRAGLADLLAFLGEFEGRDDYLERALAEYAAAGRHFGEAGHARRRASAAHGAGRVLLLLDKFAEAHERLDRALTLLGGPDDADARARIDATRARLLLAEGRAGEAEELAGKTLRTLEAGGEWSLLASALTTHGVALARLARYEPAQASFRRAAEAAGRAGDAEAEGLAALALVEELSRYLPARELAESFERAAARLALSPSIPVHARLCACARRVVSLAREQEPPRDWEGFSFKDAVHRFEAAVIGRALADAGGSVSRAAHLLGFRHHNSLASILNNRHRGLLNERSPIRPRRRSIISMRARARAPRFAGAARAASVLHVEDDQTVADAVRGALHAEGWRVETCADGAEALARLRGATAYDLLLLDYELPGANGIEIAREARTLAHRQETPIIMFSATDCEREALDAGVDAFLHKPQDVSALAATAKRLLPEHGKVRRVARHR